MGKALEMKQLVLTSSDREYGEVNHDNVKKQNFWMDAKSMRLRLRIS
jgi:hypothetical protein